MRFVHALLACCSLLFAGFCAFGFLASFEPVPYAVAWRVGYAGLCVSSLAASGMLALHALRGGGGCGVNPTGTG
jgi:hypothetical protein